MPHEKIRTVPPMTATGGGGRACPECGHDFEEAMTNLFNPLRRLLRMKPAPARCGGHDADLSGWSAGERCSCQNAFHGS